MQADRSDRAAASSASAGAAITNGVTSRGSVR